MKVSSQPKEASSDKDRVRVRLIFSPVISTLSLAIIALYVGFRRSRKRVHLLETLSPVQDR